MFGGCERAGCTCPALGRLPVYDVVSLALCPGCQHELAADAQQFEPILDRRGRASRKLDVRKAALGVGLAPPYFDKTVREADEFAEEIVRIDGELRDAARAWARDTKPRHEHGPAATEGRPS